MTAAARCGCRPRGGGGSAGACKEARRLFAEQEALEKRRLLDFVLSNCQWDDGRLTATFRQPFDLLSETIAAAKNEDIPDGFFAPNFEKWLPGQDSNLRQGG